MKRLMLILSCFLAFLATPVLVLGAQQAKDVTIETPDAVKIAATYYPGEKNKPGLVLLHQLSRNRNDWRSFAFDCQEKGYHVLAIDLRGHGQSTEGKNGRKLDFQKFSDTDYENMVQDVSAGVQWLLDQGGVNSSKIGIIGASIGANQALTFAASGKTPVKTVVLLSPGIDYRGVNITTPAKNYAGSSLWVSMTGDEYSTQSVKGLTQNAGGNAVTKIYSGKEHGTNMFKNPDLKKLLAEWLARYLE
jgi:dienelactone hydrolase